MSASKAWRASDGVEDPFVTNNVNDTATTSSSTTAPTPTFSLGPLPPAPVAANSTAPNPDRRQSRGTIGPVSDAPCYNLHDKKGDLPNWPSTLPRHFAREAAAFDNILGVVGILGQDLPPVSSHDDRSMRQRQYDYITYFVQDLLAQKQDLQIAKMGLQKDLDDAEENVECLELDVKVRDDYEDLLEASHDRVAKLEARVLELENENAKLKA